MVQTEFERYVVDRLDTLTQSVSKTCNELTEIKTKLNIHLEQKEKEDAKKYARIKLSIALFGVIVGSISVYNFVSQFFSH